MRLLVVALLLGVSACSLEPALDEPALPVAPAYPALPEQASSATHAHDLGWRSMFGDPRLQRSIELALDHNRDLRLAALQVEAVRAQYGIERAARFPAVDATGAVARQRAAANDQIALASPSEVRTEYAVNIGLAAFEIDLFGRMRSMSDAAFARYVASEHGRKAAQIALVAAVAEAYFAERLAQEQTALAERTLRDWKQSLDLARQLQAAHQNSGLDVAQAEGQVATAEAELEVHTRTAAQAGNALRLLMGTELPADVPAALPLDEQSVVTQLPPGLPSELLVHRPDILQAEQNLRAANADIGAARAAFFPRLSLTSSIGYASPDLSNLFDDRQRAWNFAPQLTLPLFQGGRLRSELRLAEVRKLSAVAEYERAIQIAFREVADGLAVNVTFDRQIDAQRRAVASAERRVALSNLRYRAGVDGRLELLDSQRQLSSAQLALLASRRDAIGNAIALYRALGGGLLENGR
ncbi:MAG: efflux transporter outer membrane subunit [Pseudomonadota bacterium]|nr:efflux transporter outer membrane subunit [Pseudomonadota bacterium]